MTQPTPEELQDRIERLGAPTPDPQEFRPLLIGELDPDPFIQFKAWLAEAVDGPIRQPLGMTVATTTASGHPSARIVLLRGVDERGFVFFTNYESRKGEELGENPRAALCIWWAELGRQVRVAGRVEKTTLDESDEYFYGRPRGSRLAAAASPQSRAIEAREEIERAMAELDQANPEEKLTRPDFWGGYRVAPETIEFWHEGPHRVHDRYLYRRNESGAWRIERLAP